MVFEPLRDKIENDLIAEFRPALEAFLELTTSASAGD